MRSILGNDTSIFNLDCLGTSCGVIDDVSLVCVMRFTPLLNDYFAAMLECLLTVAVVVADLELIAFSSMSRASSRGTRYKLTGW